jgi:hypothetical protein
LHHLAGDLAARLDAIAASHTPRLVPPVPIAVHWKPVKLGSLDLGSPLVALTAADLDGDGKAELYAVTSREVVAIALVDKRLKELARVPFTGERAVPTPRDVVGMAIVDKRTIVASVSSYQRSLRVAWKGKTLVGDPGELGFELCPGERAPLVPGRNYFDLPGSPHGSTYGSRCRDDLVDGEGHPLHVRAQLSIAGKLDVAVERCGLGGVGCRHAEDHTYPKVGVAFELADLDRDGKPELAFADAGAPGDPDEVRVVTLGEDDKKTKLKKVFTAGGVAGLTAADLDGDGATELIAAVRLVGASRVDLWRMN